MAFSNNGKLKSVIANHVERDKKNGLILSANIKWETDKGYGGNLLFRRDGNRTVIEDEFLSIETVSDILSKWIAEGKMVDAKK